MNMLFLTSVVPFPPHSGYQIACYNIIKCFSTHFNIYLLTFMHSEKEAKNLEHMRKYCKEVYGIVGAKTTVGAVVKNLFSMEPLHVMTHKNRRFAYTFHFILAKRSIDIIFFNHMYFAQYMNKDISIKYFTVLHQHGFDRDVWRKRAKDHPNFIYRIYSQYNLLKTKRYERMHYKNFNLYSFVSLYDLESAIQAGVISDESKAIYFPAGVDIKYYKPSNIVPEKNSILFTGSNAERNFDALQYFYTDIFPLVKKKIPTTKLVIAGTIGVGNLNFLCGDKNVIVTGKVNRIVPFFDHAMVYVMPFRLGGGLKLKVLEAMAMGKPIVSTTAGVQGIRENIKSGKNIIIADNPGDFAQRIVDLFQDENLRFNIGHNSRLTVEKEYDWDIVVEKFVKEIDRRMKVKF